MNQHREKFGKITNSIFKKKQTKKQQNQKKIAKTNKKNQT